MSRKDIEIARLRDALAREQAAHDETRKMLADLIAKQPAPWPAICPLPHAQPQPLPSLIDPGFLCADCRRSTSGRCAAHAVTFIPIMPNPADWTEIAPFFPDLPGTLTVGDPPLVAPFPGVTFIPAGGFTVTSH